MRSPSMMEVAVRWLTVKLQTSMAWLRVEGCRLDLVGLSVAVTSLE
jgi:hypothetical protein